MAQMPIAFAFGQMLKENAFPVGNTAFSNPAKAFSERQPTQPNDMYCSGCGRKLEADTKFCAGCGKPVASDNICAKCGRELKSDENFCPNCGTKREG